MPKIKHNRPMTDRQRRFVEEYLVDCNAAAAAVRAGYSEKSARRTASELKTVPVIQAALKAAMVIIGHMLSFCNWIVVAIPGEQHLWTR